MGCADIVPGVSGGTIALILGIYRAFIANLRKGASTLKAWLKGDLSGGWAIFSSIEWLFIVPLGAGAATAQIDRGRRRPVGDNDGNAAAHAGVFGVADGNTGHVGDAIPWAWLHGAAAFNRSSTAAAMTLALATISSMSMYSSGWWASSRIPGP